MVLAEVCRKFHIRVDSRSKLSVKTPLFLDPQGIYLKVTPRAPGVPVPVSIFMPSPADAEDSHIGHLEQLVGKKATVLFGSNMGTCEELADKVVASCERMGMTVQKAPLDHLASGLTLPKGAAGLALVITSTYNGRPPNNALKFDAWLETPAAADALRGVRFAIYGSGNKQWSATYMKFPRRIQERFEKLGAEPLVTMGEGDMDGGEVEASFARWDVSAKIAVLQAYRIPIPDSIKETMYPKPLVYDAMLYMGKRLGDVPQSARTALVAEGAQRARDLFLKDSCAFRGEVTTNRELLNKNDRSTRHIQVGLPEDTSYTAGDHLGVLGANPDSVVFAYMDHLGLAHDAVIRLELAPGLQSLSHMPLNQQIGAFTVLAMGFELQQPATRNQLRALATYAKCTPEADHLRRLSEFGEDNCGEPSGDRQDAYEREVLSQRRTVLEILQEHRSVDIPLGALLGLLPPMRPRYYSISSSPKKAKSSVSITVSVVQGLSPTGRQHLGLCSTYLKSQPKAFPQSVRPCGESGESVKMPLWAFVKDTGSSFRLPKENVPIIMVGPGTGVAPMRGFIEDRLQEGRKENVLFFGCRDESEYIYREELEQYQGSGSLKLFVAFSRKAGAPKAYVQQLIVQQAAMIADMIKRGAFFYVCGDASKMAPEVKATVARLLEEAGEEKGYLDRMVEEGRYCEDVWAAQSL
jgi:cytochrome P450/NADPH-cytochrome P450 reductase